MPPATSTLTLAHVRSLLAPGGVLVAFESTRHPRWFDVTTGLIEGWQRFEDAWRTDVPLIDADTLAGRARPGRLRLDDGRRARRRPCTAACCSTSSLPARPADEAAAPLRPRRRERRRARAASVAAGPRRRRRAAQLEDALDDERLGIIVGTVRRGNCARAPDPGPRPPPARPAAARPRVRLADGGRAAQRAAPIARARAEAAGDAGLRPPDHRGHRHLPRTAARPPSPTRDDRDGEPTPDPRSASTPRSTVADLSDDEVEALLLAKLTEIES